MITLLGAGQGQNFAPSLSFDWLNTNSLTSQEGYPLTFTRASQATYWGSDGLLKTASNNEARFEYDPNTLVKRGLKIEPQATNIQIYSEDITNATYGKIGITTSFGVGLTVDGTTNANKIIESSANEVHELRGVSFSFASGQTWTVSCFAKQAERRYFRFGIGGGQGFCVFDLQTGINTYQSSPYATFSENLGNGWWKISITKTINTTGTNTCYFGINFDSTTATTYTGNGTNGILIFGINLKNANAPCSYIKSTTATVTRSADLPLMSTGAWFNSSEGSVLTRYRNNYMVSTDIDTIVSLNDGTANNRILHRTNNGSGVQQMLVSNGGTEQANITASGILTGVDYKTAIGYKLNDFALVSNGGSIATDTSGIVPVVNTLRLGSNIGTTESINGWLQSFKYYNRKLPNATLQALTA
jgi:hypothetical protein